MKKRTKADDGRQKGKEAMATKTKTQQKIEDEAAAAQALFLAITAPDAKSQREAAKLAAELANRISRAALERAKRKAIAMADAKAASEKPALTEHVVMAAVQAFDGVCDRHDVDDGCRDVLWQTMATFCLWQLKQKRGPFYEQARGEGVLDEVLS